VKLNALLFNIPAHSDKNLNLFTGVTYPSIPPLITLWVPEMERARFVSFTYLGGALGSAVCFPIAGLILEWGGWETVFYLFGRYQDISTLELSNPKLQPGTPDFSDPDFSTMNRLGK
jgi:MFS family permease